MHCLWLGITWHHAKVISGSTTSHLLSLFRVLILRSFFQLLGQWSLIQRPSMMSTQMLRFPNNINQMYRMDTEISGFPFRNRAPLGVDRLPKGASMADWLSAWRLAVHRATRPVWGRGWLYSGEHIFFGQIGMKCFKMYYHHARCQKTFWQMKTHQSCLDLASFSSGLVWGASPPSCIFKTATAVSWFQVWGVWRARLSWRSALSYLLHTTDLDCKWTRVRESGANQIIQKRWQKSSKSIAGWACSQPSVLIWRWRALWQTGRTKKIWKLHRRDMKKNKLASSKLR